VMVIAQTLTKSTFKKLWK